jgi:hypothetical protein
MVEAYDFIVVGVAMLEWMHGHRKEQLQVSK